MYTLVRRGFRLDGLRSQAPSLTATLVLAEAFYKFHSFTLEFMAALATWFVLDAALSSALSGVRAIRGAAQRPGEARREG
ncbi:MAG: hypothetical protein ACRDJ4_01450 [Actinomycetota bacterium]